MCIWAAIGILMWAELVYGAGEGSSTAERRLRVTPQPADAGSNPVPVPTPDWQYPEIPECYLRPQFIPVEMPDKDTPETCDKFVRFMQQGKR